jgi:hypothetical protein
MSAVCTAVTCCTARPVASTTSTPGRISKSRSGFVAAGSARSAKPAKTVASQVRIQYRILKTMVADSHLFI